MCKITFWSGFNIRQLYCELILAAACDICPEHCETVHRWIIQAWHWQADGGTAAIPLQKCHNIIPNYDLENNLQMFIYEIK